jgi:hypothetical protein
MKFKFNRIKKPHLKPDSKRPDYEGFFRTPRGDFQVLGWLENLSSDMDVTIQKITPKFLENKYNLSNYSKWLSTIKKN